MSVSRVLIAVGPPGDGLRVDRFLQLALAGVSRQRIKRLLDAGQLRIDGRIERRAGRVLRRDELLELSGLEPVPPVPAVLSDVRILFRDEALLVVDKPAGLSTHAVEAGDTRHLVAAVQAWCSSSATPLEPGGPFVASRLDKETSGVVVFGLTRDMGRRLTELFTGREVLKTYRALVHGQAPEEGVIDAPLLETGRGRHGVRTNGKPAVTRFRLLTPSPAGDTSMLEVHPETGRTHQIRVHLASIGHPLVGDLLYGGCRLPGVHRCLLHAERLELVHPATGERLELCAPLPVDFTIPLHSPPS